MKKVDLLIRSWTKSFTWRILGILILLPLTYIFTGKWESAAALTLIFHVIRMVLYVVHERLWEMTSWGRGDSTRKLWFYLALFFLILSFALTILLLWPKRIVFTYWSTGQEENNTFNELHHWYTGKDNKNIFHTTIK